MDTLEALRLYVTIAETGSFSAAARQVSVSTSTVTVALQQLEEQARVSLITRSTRAGSTMPKICAVPLAAVRFIRKAMRSPSLSAILEPNIAGENQLETDEDIVRHIKEKTTTMRHPVGSCRMGADDRAVVDAHLRVKGVEGFRIIVASISATTGSGNTTRAR